MSDKAELAIRGAVVVSDGAYARDILIRDGRITALVEPGASDAQREIDARGLLALPGMVDAHVHFNEPGRTEWEGWASGSRAAAAGGTTTVLDMPLNSVPPVLDGDSFDVKKDAAQAASVVDFGLWGGLVDADPASLRELSERGAVGVKAFLCDSGVAEFPALHADDLVPALRASAPENTAASKDCAPATPPHVENRSADALRSGGHGEWSEATKSIFPSSSAFHSPSRLRASRIGGAHLSAAPCRASSAASNVR